MRSGSARAASSYVRGQTSFAKRLFLVKIANFSSPYGCHPRHQLCLFAIPFPFSSLSQIPLAGAVTPRGRWCVGPCSLGVKTFRVGICMMQRFSNRPHERPVKDGDY
jgi:hypothetical protein